MKRSFVKIISILLIAIFAFSCFSVNSFAAVRKDRYCVLVLDCSGSMWGTPVEELKEAANAFCDQVFSARGTNYVAIVSFESSANLLCDFTNNKETLKNAITGLYASGGTNLADGISTAYSALQAIDDVAIKNMIVMCDGYPNSESAAYTAVESIPLFYNIYGLYFSQSGHSDSAYRVMQTIGRNGCVEVSDGSSLEFSFVDKADTVTKQSANLIKIRIACPVDVSITFNGITLDKNNLATLFGTLTFEGDNNEIKILTLSYNKDYEINITGTGDGKMNCSFEYLCNDTSLVTYEYPTVSITPSTNIATGTDVNQGIDLSIDSDGDGIVDKTVSAKETVVTIWYKIQQFFDKIWNWFLDVFGKMFGWIGV